MPTDFVYDTGSVPETKSDLKPLPGGALSSNYWRSVDANLIQADLTSIRTALIAGQYHGIADNPSAPLSGAGVMLLRSNSGTLQASYNGGAYANVSVPSSMAAFGSAPNANGGTFTSGALTIQPADATHPGAVSTAAQTFGGAKTFAAGIVLSAAQTITFGDATTQATGGITAIASVGSSPAAAGASLSTGTLTLQPADATHPGLVSTAAQTFGGAKTAPSWTAAASGGGTFYSQDTGASTNAGWFSIQQNAGQSYIAIQAIADNGAVQTTGIAVYRSGRVFIGQTDASTPSDDTSAALTVNGDLSIPGGKNIKMGGGFNNITLTSPSATGNPVTINATGGDLNVDISMLPKGSGTVKMPSATITGFGTGLLHSTSGGVLSSSLVTLADHATLAANSFIANNTGSAATPIAMTVAQAKTLLGYSFSDLSGSVAAAQLPNPSASTLGGIESYVAVSHQWINAISTSGVPSSSQPAFSDISGSVAASQLPNPSASTLGGVESYAAVSNQWINAISTSGVPSSTQPATTNLSDFPSQTSNSGKYLTTNGTTLSWGSISGTLSGGSNGQLAYWTGATTLSQSGSIYASSGGIGIGADVVSTTFNGTGFNTPMLFVAASSAGTFGAVGTAAMIVSKFLGGGLSANTQSSIHFMGQYHQAPSTSYCTLGAIGVARENTTDNNSLGSLVFGASGGGAQFTGVSEGMRLNSSNRLLIGGTTDNGSDLLQVYGSIGAGQNLANKIAIAGATTTNAVTITATGTDTNIHIQLVPKNAGTVKLGQTTLVGTGVDIAYPYSSIAGSPGAGTVNNCTGRAAIANGASSVVVTSSVVGASSIVIVQDESTGTGVSHLSVAVSAGSFTVTNTAAGVATTVTGNSTFSFLCMN